MTTIQMLRTAHGSEDNFSIQTFSEGNIYEVRDGLACFFINKGYAREVYND